MPEAAPKHETVASADMASVRRQTIAAQVRAVLRRDIIAGRLLPRATLSEQELSHRFGVSRTPIREALIKLAEENLLEIYPQYGTFVAPIKLREVFDSQFVRESLECSAVERAVERIDARQGKALAGLLKRQRVLHRAGDHEGFFLADESMHALIMEIAGHANAWRQVENAKAQMDRVRFLSMRNVRKQPSVVAEHTLIVDRIAHRDRAGAVAAMRSHLRGLFRSVEILAAKEPGYFVDETAGGSGPPPRAVASAHHAAAVEKGTHLGSRLSRQRPTP